MPWCSILTSKPRCTWTTATHCSRLKSAWPVITARYCWTIARGLLVRMSKHCDVSLVLRNPRGVSIEGEFGVIGKVDEISVEADGQSTLTDPEMAAVFVERTGIDALAVSIGNAHGLYTKPPRLGFERLAKLKAATRVPLVLHGGSGTPEIDLRRAIGLGISNVNVATELINAARESLLDQWHSSQNLWVPMAEAVAMKAMAKVVEK